MKFALTLALILSALPFAAARADIMVPAAMQRCSADDQCVLTASACETSCATLPVNKGQMAAIANIYSKRCGKAPDANGTCTSTQVLEPACINGRCTIGYLPHSAGDYKPGAYPVPEAPVAYEGTNDYSSVNDTDGNFSAYSLPPELVRQNMMGQYSFPAN